MFEVGRLCVKIAGRDAGKKCVVVEVLDRTYVLVDGETRRRKCNIAHLEPMDNVLDIQKGASHESVTAALKKEGLEARLPSLSRLPKNLLHSESQKNLLLQLKRNQRPRRNLRPRKTNPRKLLPRRKRQSK